MKVLIIEDCKEYRELIYNNISKNDEIYVDESDSLINAIKKMNEKEYDIIILDLSLPESDGIDTIKSIKKEIEENNHDTQIIIITGFEDYKIGKKAFELGVKDFLIKDEINFKDIFRSLNLAVYHKI